MSKFTKKKQIDILPQVPVDVIPDMPKVAEPLFVISVSSPFIDGVIRYYKRLCGCEPIIKDGSLVIENGDVNAVGILGNYLLRAKTILKSQEIQKIETIIKNLKG